MFADFTKLPYGSVLKTITNAVAALPQVEAVILFGSRARGDNMLRADIDLAVSYPKKDSILRSKIDEIIEEAPTLLPIDCVHLEEVYSDLKENIFRDGKWLFKREEVRKADISLEKLGRALKRLKTSLDAPLDEEGMIRDSCIQRFEFVMELYWKTFKHLLEEEGVEIVLPKQALQKAYQAKWIEDEKLWLNMLVDRNQTSHSYNEDIAQEIYEHLHSYYPALKQTYAQLVEVR